jgi:hypothetical protein
MTPYDESVLRLIRETAGDPQGLSQEALVSLYDIRQHSRDMDMKAQVENIIRRILLKEGRYRL